MKIQTRKILVDFKGEPLKSGTDELTVGISISTILANDEAPENRMKKYILATKFFQNEEVTVDSADFEIIKSSIEKTKTYLNIVVGQVLEYLSNLKENTGSKKDEE